MKKTQLPYAHPVDDATRHIITTKLGELEQQHNIRILFACESGSRAWGFASPDSDYDVRFIYVHTLQWYLSVQIQRDVLELPINDMLDIGGWELRKTLQLLHASNPTLFEWLQSPIMYHKDTEQHQKLHTLAHEFFNPVKAWHHYQSMAHKTYQAHLQRDTVRYKKYLYALRPLLAADWVRAYQTMPPMRFVDLAEAMLDIRADAELIDSIKQLLTRKMQTGEATSSAPCSLLQQWILTKLEANKNAPFSVPTATLDCAVLDNYLYQAIVR